MCVLHENLCFVQAYAPLFAAFSSQSRSELTLIVRVQVIVLLSLYLDLYCSAIAVLYCRSTAMTT
jgi:hypothetical protein